MRCQTGSTTSASATSPDLAQHSAPRHRRALASSAQRNLTGPHRLARGLRIKATLRSRDFR
jgi:hypothetical protein